MSLPIPFTHNFIDVVVMPALFFSMWDKNSSSTGREKESERDKRKKFTDRDRGGYGPLSKWLSVSPCGPEAVADPVKPCLSLNPLSHPLLVPAPTGTEESLERERGQKQSA